jgi:hypothetical protein
MFDESSENVPAQAQRPLRSRLYQCIRPDGSMQGSDAVYAGSMGTISAYALSAILSD